MIKKFMFILSALCCSLHAFAQGDKVEMADTMRSEGKIYVVVAIILIVLVGMVLYLFIIDRNVKKLEKQVAAKAK